MRYRNVSDRGDLLVTGHGLIRAGDEFDSDDEAIGHSPNFEQIDDGNNSTPEPEAAENHEGNE